MTLLYSYSLENVHTSFLHSINQLLHLTKEEGWCKKGILYIKIIDFTLDDYSLWNLLSDVRWQHMPTCYRELLKSVLSANINIDTDVSISLFYILTCILLCTSVVNNVRWCDCLDLAASFIFFFFFLSFFL